MLQHLARKAILLTRVLALVWLLLPVAQTQAQQSRKQQPHAGQAQKQQQKQKQQKQQQSTLTAPQAAARAKAQYGGEVLKVTPSGKGYQVRLLTESGRVRTVTIQD